MIVNASGFFQNGRFQTLPDTPLNVVPAPVPLPAPAVAEVLVVGLEFVTADT